jgi:hypothetical protein
MKRKFEKFEFKDTVLRQSLSPSQLTMYLSGVGSLNATAVTMIEA